MSPCSQPEMSQPFVCPCKASLPDWAKAGRRVRLSSLENRGPGWRQVLVVLQQQSSTSEERERKSFRGGQSLTITEELLQENMKVL
ncbi:hypothetical protein OJAV_G00205470 [Oryzias javanicus]|uniref:Uncharacterized protein n=1 Tax=Oryzias javanicus TaxID=123683 RepID=A0A437C660_ORYJA|nr:hypothetical protein OJAV_G00205470 [Oryzias javanicus]